MIVSSKLKYQSKHAISADQAGCFIFCLLLSYGKMYVRGLHNLKAIVQQIRIKVGSPGLSKPKFVKYTCENEF
jgi:hypothetical protein